MLMWNTTQQLERVMELYGRYGFMQISGEDINQPRQSFICEKLSEHMFAHLTDSAWALVGHEKATTKDIRNAMFADGRRLSTDELKQRIEKYKSIGLETDQ